MPSSRRTKRRSPGRAGLRSLLALRLPAAGVRLRILGAAAGAVLCGLVIGLVLSERAVPPSRSVAIVEAPVARPPAPPERAPEPILEHVAPAPAAPPVAVLPPPPPSPPARADAPAWLRYAVAPPPLQGWPLVAIVLDDLGLDKLRTERAIGLPAPLTLSFMTYADELDRQTAAAREAGHELLLHVPMEPVSARADPGPNGLLVQLGRDEILRRLRWGLGRFPGYVGINNHMGSKFTADSAAMAPVIEELRERGLLFLDSRTTAATVGAGLARQMGVPHAARDVFLDDDPLAPAVGARLAEVEQVARRKGNAIAIGHAHDGTLAALAEWLKALPAKHLTLVPLSTVVHGRAPSG